MSFRKIMLILGTRPQIIKSTPLIYTAEKDSQIEVQVVHTGQHYDYEMSREFFQELRIPGPTVNLNIGSGTHAWQTGEMMIGLEKTLVKEKPDLVIVPGDTNSTLAGALSAAKLHLPVGHVEAGARSYDMKMPEEINRRLTDHCSTLLFAPTENCVKNLLNEGIPKAQIFLTGDTMYDALLQHLPHARRSEVLHELSMERKAYALLTIHRPENVDKPETLRNIIDAMTQLKDLPIVFPVHPRTKERLYSFNLRRKLQKEKHIRIIKPASYHDTLQLIENARILFTDSGGMQKEAFWLRTPCMTLRNNTEWIETVQLGANFLTGPHTQEILRTSNKILGHEEVLASKIERLSNPFGDGNASQKIVDSIKNFGQKRG